VAAVAAVAWQRDRAGLPAWPAEADVPPWRRGDGWRPGAPAAQLVSLDSAGGPREVRVQGTPARALVRFEADAGPAPLAVELQPAAVVVDGIRRPLAWAVGEDGRLWLNYAGRTMVWQLRDRARRLQDALEQLHRESGEVSPEVRSPMPGTVTAVAVRSGEQVRAGQLLLSVEAMKMEHQLTAPLAGQAVLSLAPGDLVKAGQVLAVIHPPGPETVPPTQEGPDA